MGDGPQIGARDWAFEAPNFAGVLPAAGAYTAQPYSDVPPEARRLGVNITYTPDPAASAPQPKYYVQWRVENTPDINETFVDGSSVSVGEPFAEVPQYIFVVKGPVLVDSNPLAYRALSLEVPMCATGVRVLIAEAGDASHPGTVKVELFTSSVI